MPETRSTKPAKTYTVTSRRGDGEWEVQIRLEGRKAVAVSPAVARQLAEALERATDSAAHNLRHDIEVYDGER